MSISMNRPAHKSVPERWGIQYPVCWRANLHSRLGTNVATQCTSVQQHGNTVPLLPEKIVDSSFGPSMSLFFSGSNRGEATRHYLTR
jgi:hypothetical protein